jgi:hypothetical protein
MMGALGRWLKHNSGTANLPTWLEYIATESFGLRRADLENNAITWSKPTASERFSVFKAWGISPGDQELVESLTFKASGYGHVRASRVDDLEPVYDLWGLGSTLEEYDSNIGFEPIVPHEWSMRTNANKSIIIGELC